MATLPEAPSFDAGVYQIERADPVVGGPEGVTNAPLQNLANRTVYLKQRADDLELTKAPLASPTFTGNPKAPTPSPGDSSPSLATTAFVQTARQNDQGTAAPKMDGAATVGVSAKLAREDHVHPSDTSRAPTVHRHKIGDIDTLSDYLGQIAAALIPAGTRMVFYQASAPSGWTQVNDDFTHNRLMRVVNGAGGQVGGDADPCYNDRVPNHAHTFTTAEAGWHGHTFATSQNGSHQHPVEGHTGGMSADHTHSHQRAALDWGGGDINHARNRVERRETLATSGASTGHVHWFAANTGWNGQHGHDGATDGSGRHTHAGITNSPGGANVSVWAARYFNVIVARKD